MIETLFRERQSVLSNEISAEIDQSKQRPIVVTILLIYVVSIGIKFDDGEVFYSWVYIFQYIYLLAMFLAFVTYFFVRIRPGHYPIRRFSVMILDYSFITIAIAANPVQMIPLYAVLLWVTVGNGLRFGPRYLAFATMLALLAIIVTQCLISRADKVFSPYFAGMLTLLVVAIPLYASSLLQRVEQARHEADAANLAKSRFLAQASHDLRQPLHAISLFTTSLQATGLNKSQQAIVNRIDRALQSVSRLFRSLLDISTLDSGAMQPKLEPTALGDLLHEIVQQSAQIAAWDNSDLRLVNAKHVVLTDRAILMAMIQNLVSNALKFSAGRSVLIGCRRRGPTIAIEVWDQGDGIAEEHLPLLFDEFYQIKKHGERDRQGVGLGLSIVARMAALLDLNVEVTSCVGKGSCFKIVGLMPLLTQTEPGSASPADNEWLPLKGFKILIVEDDADVLEATAGILSAWGCVVIAETRIPETIHPCDMIITDFDLGGGKTGSDCINCVRKALQRPVPAILITGHEANRIAAEINDPDILVLKKPLRPAELRSTISSIRATLHPN